MSEIAKYDLDIKHRRGELVKHADALSQAAIQEKEYHIEGRVIIIESNESEILVFQRSGPDILELITILKKKENERDRNERTKINDFVLRYGFLYKNVVRDSRMRELYVVPKAKRKSLVIRFHDLANQFGIEKTAKRNEEYLYFPRLRRYVRFHINCLEYINKKEI